MARWTFCICCILVGMTLWAPAVPARAADGASPALGRWDITLGGGQPCWLEITRKDDQYAGRFLFIYASVFDLKKIAVEGNKIEFECKGTKGDGPGDTFTGMVEGDAITGETVNKEGKKGKWTAKRFVPRINVAGVWAIEGRAGVALRLRQEGDRIGGSFGSRGEGRPARLIAARLDGDRLQFTAGDKLCTARVKGDAMEGEMAGEKFTAQRNRAWGEPVELFNGKDLNGWKPLGAADKFKWKVVDGLMHCDGHGSSNIVTERTFEDFKLHVEFKVPKDGNSGVYLRGRYEVQVADSGGHNPDPHNCGGLYSRITPKETACGPAGEWQTFDITLIGQYLTVVHNGKTLIDNQDVEGITGGAIDSEEARPGPIYLQGDHTAVDYRKITLTPAQAPIAGRRTRASQ